MHDRFENGRFIDLIVALSQYNRRVQHPASAYQDTQRIKSRKETSRLHAIKDTRVLGDAEERRKEIVYDSFNPGSNLNYTPRH